MEKYIVTHDFGKVLPEAEPQKGDYVDERNLIVVRDPSFSIDSYIAYLELIKEYAMNSINNQMLQLGFIPIVMPPSFMGEVVHLAILPYLPKDLPTYPREAIGFRNPRFHYVYPDIWVSKLDIAKLFGCKIENVTVREVLNRCGGES